MFEVVDIKAKLRYLRAVLDQPDAEKDRELFEEFLSNNELSLALHVICDYVIENEEWYDADILRQIKELHLAMGIDDDCVARLTRRSP